MMVLSGNRTDAKEDGHYIASDNGVVGLWFGTIDDLWAMGKPVGQGGPWYNSRVKAHVPSDPYLMTGYDKKKVTLHHQSSQDIRMTIQVDPTGYGDWKPYKTFRVAAGKIITHTFPTGFNARWVRLVASEDCIATADFLYQ